MFKASWAKGQTSPGYFIGFKLDLSVDHIGENISINNVARSFLAKSCKGVKRLIFGYRDYISKEKAQLLEEQELKLSITLKNSQTSQASTDYMFKYARLCRQSW